jgi:hypothetical protein
MPITTKHERSLRDSASRNNGSIWTSLNRIGWLLLVLLCLVTAPMRAETPVADNPTTGQSQDKTISTREADLAAARAKLAGERIQTALTTLAHYDALFCGTTARPCCISN